ncbi:MAG: IS3 family transposase [Salinivirgaceae bacterium]
MTELFNISRQAYYQLLTTKSKTALEVKTICRLVLQIRRTMPRIGGRKLYYLLQPEFVRLGINIGRDRFFDILRREHLLVKKRKNHTRTTNSYHRYRKYNNLLQHTRITRPEQAWVSDITYIRTRKGFLYLSLVTDAYSKKIMGYELSDNLKTESSLRALKKAVKNRKYADKSLIHHSDRGFQYCSPTYTQMLETNGINISMTTKYDPYENAVAERVNGILKSEFFLDQTFYNKQHALREVKRTIDVYNSLRPHLSCNYLTPNQAHNTGNYKLKQWSRNFSSREASLEENKTYI